MSHPIGHQVKTLEDYLGVQLFLREIRGVVLTSDGTDYLHALTDILDHLAAATAQVRSADASGPLSVRATPGFASRWLMPRLAAFHEAWPAIRDRLVRLFDLSLPPAIIYSVVTPEAWSSRPKIAAFRNWLLMEAGMGKQGNGHSLAAA